MPGKCQLPVSGCIRGYVTQIESHHTKRRKACGCRKKRSRKIDAGEASMWIFDPTEGRVLLNGEDIRKYNRKEYYGLFSAVFQDFSILAGTIAENVAQSVEEIDDSRVKEAIKDAGLKENVERLPEQYETRLGRSVHLDAYELSGGETQRLMLARALYRNAPVIVLDEPTAALDPIAESDLYERYHELTKGSTSIYVSHRLGIPRSSVTVLS